jgi:hypothetical protein
VLWDPESTAISRRVFSAQSKRPAAARNSAAAAIQAGGLLSPVRAEFSADPKRHCAIGESSP